MLRTACRCVTLFLPGPAEKGSRPPSRTGSDYDEDDVKSFSTASQKSFGGRNGSSGWEAELEEIEDDPFHDNVEKLYEKRCTALSGGCQWSLLGGRV